MNTFSWPTFWSAVVLAIFSGIIAYRASRAGAAKDRITVEELEALDEYGRALERARKACFAKEHRVGSADTRAEDAARIGESLSALGEIIDAKSRRLPAIRRASASELAGRLGSIMGLANSAMDIETFFGNVKGLDKRLADERDAVEELRGQIVGH